MEFTFAEIILSTGEQIIDVAQKLQEKTQTSKLFPVLSITVELYGVCTVHTVKLVMPERRQKIIIFLMMTWFINSTFCCL